MSEINEVRLLIETKYGFCTVRFPYGSKGCVIEGRDEFAKRYVLENRWDFVMEHGHSVDFDNITPNEFLKYCHNHALGITTLKDFDVFETVEEFDRYDETGRTKIKYLEIYPTMESRPD